MQLLRDPERFRTDEARSPIRDTFGAQMLSTEGERQRRHKSACAPPVNARATEESRPLVEGVVARAMLTHPQALVRARASSGDLGRCIDESLRWEPAVQTLTRYAADAAMRGGVPLPRDAGVQCMIGGMNREALVVALG